MTDTLTNPVSNLVTLPLALPAPEWHSNRHHPHNGSWKIENLTDAELDARIAAQGQFFDYILTGQKDRCHLWRDFNEGADKVERMLLVEAGRRWVRGRDRKRSAARIKRTFAKQDREWKRRTNALTVLKSQGKQRRAA